jgi:dTDP-6-deoxy-L-talose 4-dehydrogenase (NAD+)
MKVLVTGAAGYVGRHVLPLLIANGHEVVVTVHETPVSGSGLTAISADVLEHPDDLYFKAGKPDLCIHLAWQNGFFHNDIDHLHRAHAHLALLEGLLRAGLRHVAIIGSMHEIGYHVGAVTETTPTRPLHSYGVAKNFLREASEILARKYGAVWQWLRCYYVTGDDRFNNSVFTKLLAAATAGQKTFPMNSGEFLYDFIDVSELGRQIEHVSTQTRVAGIINCCSGTPISLKTKVQSFIEHHGLDITPEWGAFPSRPYDSPAIWGDRTKLDDALREIA